MPQDVRPDEQAAADLVAATTGLHFEFSGGGIDFTCTDGPQRTVLEVTRCTRPMLKRDELAAAAHAERTLPIWTSRSWWVTFDGHPVYNGLPERLSEPLRRLETHGVSEFDTASHAWWMRRAPTLSPSVQALEDEHVLYARTLDMKDPHAPPQLFVSATGGFTYGGPDSALEVLESYLLSEQLHLNKTALEPADERHLFVWTDLATEEGLARALRTTWPALPTRAPALDPAPDHLWLVDEATGLGWHHGPSGWEAIEAGPPVSP